MARIEPRTNNEGKVEALRVSGQALDIAAAMLDVEANKDLPDSMRAQATFTPLVGPAFAEALQKVSDRIGDAEALLHLGELLAQLAGGVISGRLVEAPAPIRDVVALRVIEGFAVTLVRHLEDLEKHGKPESEH